jgi:hypothetical protein
VVVSDDADRERPVATKVTPQQARETRSVGRGNVRRELSCNVCTVPRVGRETMVSTSRGRKSIVVRSVLVPSCTGWVGEDVWITGIGV